MMMLKLSFEIFCTDFDLYHIIIKNVILLITLIKLYKIIKGNVFHILLDLFQYSTKATLSRGLCFC